MIEAIVTTSKLYFDHAATGWPKDESVYRAVETQMRNIGVSAGRGAYARSVVGGRVLDDCRTRAAQLLHSDPAGHWILSHSGTAALNQAIHGILRAGDHVVTTAADHNSVLRPIEWLRERGLITATIVPCNSKGCVDPDDVLDAVRAETRMIAMTHASNVTGAINSVEEIGCRIASSRNPACLLLCDAAQTAGLLPIHIQDAQIDLLAAPGHKGLGGPLGTGLLYVGPRASSQIEPLMQGGTGSQSDSLAMPSQLPGRLESGNQNVPALAGLAAGLSIALKTDLDKVYRQNLQRVVRLVDTLGEQTRFQVHSAGQLPIVSLTDHELDPFELSSILDGEFNIETRAGLHCAPLIHGVLGTLPQGTLRISFCHQTSDEDFNTLMRALMEISQ